MLRLLRAAWAALLLCTVPLGGALAHAALVAASPEDGATLAEVPRSVTLRFDEAVTLIGLRIAGPAGEVAQPAPAEAGGDTVRASLPPGLATGTYLVSWRVISADGHPIGGTLAFGLGSAPVPATTPAGAGMGGWTAAAEVLRFLLLSAFALGGGGALFRALVQAPPPSLRRWLAAASLVGVVAAAATIGFQGGAMEDAPFPGGLADPATWRAALGSTVAGRAAVTAAGLLVVAGSLLLPAGSAALLGAAGSAVAAIGLSLSGHAAAGGWPVQALLALHALAAAYWLGAFLPLLALLSMGRLGALPAVRRFSSIAIPTVAVLILSGAAQAALHLGEWRGLLGSFYGRLVVAKAVGAVLLLLLALLNRLFLTPRLSTGASTALSRSIRLEVVLGAVLLGVTAVLGMTSPHPGAVHAHAHDHGVPSRQGAIVATQVAGLDALLEVRPARPGTNTITLRLEQGDGSPARPQEVSIELSQPAAGVVGLRRRMRAEAPGQFLYQGPELALAGRWVARVEILVSDFEQVSADLGFDVVP
ncbi:copper resistance CopC/CopD family protein [Roseomonas populi]|uniref:Copper resistance protein CopC/CopD n=1 Tax=Roseomonas populi TaxID=3121582 RepID=A0ABT1X4E6_9PROT|nr:copper resistance protein CopC/CopD [Roseomonas pecuniae]MCR0982651.1 copper resistance protein CopC/CopD [Roseomonas pecuniae]